MRVLFTTFPIASHFFPMVPLAWSLRAAGHSVRVACPPAFAPAVASSGVPALPVGTDVDAGRIWQGYVPGTVAGGTAAQHDGDRSARAMRMFTAVADAMRDDLLDHARAWRPDLVVYEPRAYAGLIVAGTLGVPAVRHLWGTDYTSIRWPVEEPALRPFLAKAGLDVVDPFGALTLDPCPPSLQLDGCPDGWRMRYIPYNGTGTVPLWLDTPPERPRICLTWGTSPLAAGRLETFLQLLSRLDNPDIEIVLAVAASSRVRDRVPPGVRIVEMMPLHLLLSSCSVLVHQGGCGTALTAVARGVPQYVLPLVADGRINGRQIADRGAGLTAELDEVSPTEFQRAVEALGSDATFRRTTHELRAEMGAQSSPAHVVQMLERWRP
jgi:UDP:flavonoid glycosyltransferase YjiC (YdhE family)